MMANTTDPLKIMQNLNLQYSSICYCGNVSYHSADLKLTALLLCERHRQMGRIVSELCAGSVARKVRRPGTNCTLTDSTRLKLVP